MRYCTNCHRLSAGEPQFCNTCGRSYDYKLCPSRHSNPRNAQVCSTCGSRDLSVPHPRLPIWAAPLIWLLSALPGVLLLLLTLLFFLGLVEALIRNQQLVVPYVFGTGLLLTVLWWAYMQLPGFLRALIRKLFRIGTKGQDHREH